MPFAFDKFKSKNGASVSEDVWFAKEKPILLFY